MDTKIETVKDEILEKIIRDIITTRIREIKDHIPEYFHIESSSNGNIEKKIQEICTNYGTGKYSDLKFWQDGDTANISFKSLHKRSTIELTYKVGSDSVEYHRHSEKPIQK